MSPVYSGVINFIRQRAGLLAWWLVFCILVLSLLPSTSIPKLNFSEWLQIDKLGHISFYGSATFCFLLDLSSKNRPLKWNLLVYFGLFTMGLALEYFQSLAAQGRMFDLFDQMANTIGIISGWFGHQKLKKIFT